MTTRLGRARAVAVVLCALLLAGCWDNRDPRDRAFALAVGLDVGRRAPLEVSLQIPVPGALRGGGTSPTAGGLRAGDRLPVFQVVTAEGRSFNDAVTRAQTRLSRELYLGQVSVIVFGQRLVERGLRPVVMELVRTPEVIHSNPVVMAPRARDALAFLPPLEAVPGLYVRSFYDARLLTGRTVETRLWHLHRDLLTPGRDALLGVMQADGGQARIEGAAVLRGDRLAAVLGPVETRGLMWLRGRVRGETLVVRVDGREVTLRRVTGVGRSRLLWEGDLPRAEVDLLVTGEAYAPWTQLTARELQRVEAALAAQVRREAQAALRRLQEVGSDAAGFGLLLWSDDPWRWEAADWRAAFPRLQVELRVRVTVRGTGVRR